MGISIQGNRSISGAELSTAILGMKAITQHQKMFDYLGKQTNA
jgi:hypothetical protein